MKVFLTQNCLKKVLVLLILLFNISIVNATTINFDNLGLAFDNSDPIVTDGFVFTPAKPHIHYLGIPFPSGNGSDYIPVDDEMGDNPLNIKRVDNAVFSFNSLDLGEFFSDPYSFISFTGYNDQNIVVATQTVEMDMLWEWNGGLPGHDFQTFIFGSQWANLYSLRIDSLGPQGSHNGFSLDNFVYDEPYSIPQVPEPGTMLLLGSLVSGLFGYAGLKKRSTN